MTQRQLHQGNITPAWMMMDGSYTAYSLHLYKSLFYPTQLQHLLIVLTTSERGFLILESFLIF